MKLKLLLFQGEFLILSMTKVIHRNCFWAPSLNSFPPYNAQVFNVFKRTPVEFQKNVRKVNKQL